jgi:hypothetical protein
LATMASLTYTGITSLDGYVADADGNFGWSAPGAGPMREAPVWDNR